ncbi:hypothetical protein BYT27DRAFT_7118040 [Phlegmacium glaucopus]|nr:hypothetical protein BYT27DRAFT_7118040 [Phlegmacium glaucopus]
MLCCTATGDGKSAAFMIPCLVLLEYNNNPEAYPHGLPTRAKPIGILIIPTKGLANNIVGELSKLNISGFSYCAETLTEARKTGLRLAQEIKECIWWQVVCVDPEHLCDKEWREITEGSTFRSNVLFACVDKAHLINSWGLAFHPAFRLIGTFLRGSFPSSISIVALTATLKPGLPTELGYFFE